MTAKREPPQRDPRTKKIRDEWVEWKIQDFFRHHEYGTLGRIAAYVYGYHSYNFKIKETLELWASFGKIARVGYAANKRERKAYCLKENEQAVRRQFVPADRTKHEILSLLDEGPKCATVMSAELTHPSKMPGQLRLLKKTGAVVLVQVGVKSVYGLRDDKGELVEMRIRHQRTRIERLEREILVYVRRWPEASASDICHNVCSNSLLRRGAILALVRRGELRAIKRGKNQYRYVLAKPKRCAHCGQPLLEES